MIFNQTGAFTFQNCEMTKAESVKLAKWHKQINCLTRGDYGNFTAIAIGKHAKRKANLVTCMFGMAKYAPEKVGISEEMIIFINYLFDIHKTDKSAADFNVWVWENMPVGVNSSLILRKFMSELLINAKCGAWGVDQLSDHHLKTVSELYANLKSSQKDFEKASKDSERLILKLPVCKTRVAVMSSLYCSNIALDTNAIRLRRCLDYHAYAHAHSIFEYNFELQNIKLKAAHAAQIKLFKKVLKSFK